jgi:hypothetical protein
VRKAIGPIMVAMGVVLLDVGYSMPPGGDTGESQQSEIVVFRPAAPAIGPAVASEGGRTRWHTQTVPAQERRPTPVVVKLAARPALGPPSRATTMPGDRASLTRALIQELKRVGCYEGQLDTSWSPLTRRAMQAFNDRVNAALPVGEPNEILLSLVQNQQNRVCGVPCPTGQSLADDGRCLPNAVLAQAHKKAAPRVAMTQPNNPIAPESTSSTTSTIASWSVTATTMTPTRPDDPERMSLAGPNAAQHNATATALATPATRVPRRSIGPTHKKFGQSFLRDRARWGLN